MEDAIKSIDVFVKLLVTVCSILIAFSIAVSRPPGPGTAALAEYNALPDAIRYVRELREQNYREWIYSNMSEGSSSFMNNFNKALREINLEEGDGFFIDFYEPYSVGAPDISNIDVNMDDIYKFFKDTASYKKQYIDLIFDHDEFKSWFQTEVNETDYISPARAASTDENPSDRKIAALSINSMNASVIADTLSSIDIRLCTNPGSPQCWPPKHKLPMHKFRWIEAGGFSYLGKLQDMGLITNGLYPQPLPNMSATWDKLAGKSYVSAGAILGQIAIQEKKDQEETFNLFGLKLQQGLSIFVGPVVVLLFLLSLVVSTERALLVINIIGEDGRARRLPDSLSLVALRTWSGRLLFFLCIYVFPLGSIAALAVSATDVREAFSALTDFKPSGWVTYIVLVEAAVLFCALRMTLISFVLIQLATNKKKIASGGKEVKKRP
jgi:hypothetical protein